LGYPSNSRTLQVKIIQTILKIKAVSFHFIDSFDRHVIQSTVPDFKMPTTLQKTKKQIAKKRSGQVNSLHEKSRDSMRLHKASVRDQRLEKLAAARGKKEQPIGKIRM
jgi:hypothetical protein